MNPHVTWITVTYARPSCLNELIAAFLAQDYSGPRELLILNTYPKQTLLGTFQNVRIVNLNERPSSLGLARNMAVNMATDGIIAIADDDDQFLPHHSRLIIDQFSDGAEWAWSQRMFYLEGNQVRGIVAGNLNCVSFRKSAFSKVQYPDTLTVGEDKAFVSRLTTACNGKRVELTDSEISFLYRWGQTDDSVYHCSGLGMDEKNSVPAHKRIANWTEDRVRHGLIPTGTIVLQPALRHNYPQMVSEFLARKPAIPADSIGIVQLGRHGDLISALPVFKHICDTQQKPHIVVSREFAPLLDGCSYVIPHPVDITFHERARAIKYAERTFSKVIVTQIYGHGHKHVQTQPSWPQESWKEAGFAEHYHDKEWKLVFDRRNPQREAALVKKLFRTNKPKIICNFTAAVSVPFQHGPTILSAVQREFGKDYEVIDIGRFKCERIYDLLGIYEKASIIVTIDTATLHLAAAVDVPLVALVNPGGWLGPVPRFNCAARIPYNQASVKTVCDAIRNAPNWQRQEQEDKRILQVLATPPKLRPNRLSLKQVTLWACCWSDSKEYLMRTLRVLRYCHTIVDFYKIVFFTFQKPPVLGFPVELIQIPKLDGGLFNLFHTHNIARMLPETYCLSVHEDGFIIDPTRWDPKFLEYDFIGAAWAPDGTVGNGGHALESSRFLKAKSTLPFNDWLTVPIATTLGPLHIEPSDTFICRRHRKLLEDQGMKFAPREVASRFSTEQMDHQIASWGFHGKHCSPAKFARGWSLIEASERLT